jgi:hypothetical protein
VLLYENALLAIKILIQINGLLARFDRLIFCELPILALVDRH